MSDYKDYPTITREQLRQLGERMCRENRKTPTYAPATPSNCKACDSCSCNCSKRKL